MRRLLIAAPAAIALTAGIFLVAATPALAGDAECAAAPAQLRTAAATAEASVARRALGYINVGQKLCEEGNERAAGKKFAAAAKTLGVDTASLTAVAAAK
jgi:hypothetical protein